MNAKDTIEHALHGKGCLGRSQNDEPVFTLVARDRAASYAIREWAREAGLLGAPREKVAGALAVAAEMDAWREAHGGGRVPD